MSENLKRNDTELTGIMGIDKIDKLGEIKNAVNWRQYRNDYHDASNLNKLTPYPIQLDFELNATCNLKCPMCPLSTESNSDKKHDIFPFELFCKIIDDGVSKGLKAIKLNYLNEPLLRDDLEKFIIYAKNAGILDIYFSTNAMLLNEDRARSLIQSGVDRMQISIDAFTENTYKQMRPGGVFHKVKNNVLKLIEIRNELQSITPLVRVNFVRTELNEHELQEFTEFWKINVDMIGVQEMVKPPKTTKEFGSRTTTKKSGFSCSFPYKQLVINAQGEVLPCCTFYGEELSLGNIFKIYKETGGYDLTPFWMSDKMKELRKTHKSGRFYDNPVCNKCIAGSVNI
ncbi:radical SAM protein [Campylobacter lari]|uniref:radical SAM/SPASM domain-containing protein n=1 Tax=Campylobacter lari TaxID=201 RepID=UPI0021F6A0C0|nr:radical SAM protein [Campylobacter lari]EGK8096201.1 radical SAM protein [Campylobacter lari]MCW0187800.1 radical SAM protein [Campylobacter lari]MCW0231613.1 radical SAM protein [Campylobacter lari]